MHNDVNLVLFSLLTVSLISCANVNSSGRSDLHATQVDQEITEETNNEYILQPGNVVDIKYFYNSELNESVKIRPDGRLSLQLIDEVEAAGLTPSELDDILTEKYSKLLRHSEVAVIVREFAGQKVYVGGEVNSPGLIPISGKLTSLQAILQAGGFKDTAEIKSVLILRNQGTQKPLFVNINLKEDLTFYNQHNDILLEPYDIVFVPKTPIAKINSFISQYIDQLIPISRMMGFSWVYNLNPEVKVK